MAQAACGCGQPTRNQQVICGACIDRFHDDVKAAAELAADLALVLSRQVRHQPPTGGSRSADVPVPFDARATPAATALRDVMRNVAEAAGMRNARGATTGACARWLHLEWRRVARHEQAWQMVEAVAYQVDRVRVVCDRPPQLLYVGTCDGRTIRDQALAPVADEGGCPCVCHHGAVWRPACDVPGGCGHLHDAGDNAAPSAPSSLASGCTADLYVRPNAAQVTCPQCGTVHDVTTRRRWLLRQLQHQWATATEIARGVSRLTSNAGGDGDGGVDSVWEVKPDRIWQWRRRGRIVQRGTNERGEPLYRVGDVLDLLEKEAHRKHTSTTTRKAAS